MYQIFAGQDPVGDVYIARSVRLAGYATSIRLEAAFWDILDEIAESRGVTTPRLLAMLYDQVLERGEEIASFTSLLRVTCVRHLRGPAPAPRPGGRTMEPAAAE